MTGTARASVEIGAPTENGSNCRAGGHVLRTPTTLFGYPRGSGAVTAQAATNDPAPIVQQSGGDGEVNDATEPAGPGGAEEANDGPAQVLDANPNEPGHQDATSLPRPHRRPPRRPIR